MGPVQEAEFAAYVAARRDHVRRTAYLLCRDWHKADDLTQTAFVKLYGAWDRIRDPGAVDAYLRSCLVRATIDESRRPWRRETSSEELPERPVASAPAGLGGTSGSDATDQIADRDVMQRALAQVPERQRMVLVLRFYQGLDVAACAAQLGCSEGTVKSQTSRGLVALKSALGPDGLAAFGAAGFGGTGSGGAGSGRAGLSERGEQAGGEQR